MIQEWGEKHVAVATGQRIRHNHCLDRTFVLLQRVLDPIPRTVIQFLGIYAREITIRLH